jgi:hypothetical protein
VLAGALRNLVALCAKSQDKLVLGNAAEALANLGAHDKTRSQLVVEGAVPPLVQVGGSLTIL